MIKFIKDLKVKKQKSIEIREKLSWACNRECLNDGNRILIYGENLEDIKIIEQQIWWWLFMNLEVKERSSLVDRRKNICSISIENLQTMSDKDWLELRNSISAEDFLRIMSSTHNPET